jgi:hypothetical protein
MSELIDPTNPVMALCAQGMAVDGSPLEALRLFERAWAARRDDYDAAIAAHFVARHQSTAEDTLHWNAVAVRHAELVANGRADELLASLYLNLADAHENVGQRMSAIAALHRAAGHLRHLTPGGYREFVAFGLHRLAERVGVAIDIEPGVEVVAAEAP